jgi:hypothetical protein
MCPTTPWHTPTPVAPTTRRHCPATCATSSPTPTSNPTMTAPLRAHRYGFATIVFLLALLRRQSSGHPALCLAAAAAPVQTEVGRHHCPMCPTTPWHTPTPLEPTTRRHCPATCAMSSLTPTPHRSPAPPPRRVGTWLPSATRTLMAARHVDRFSVVFPSSCPPIIDLNSTLLLLRLGIE